MGKVKKAGCILLNNEGKIAIVYRDMFDDYSFPKGHMEEGETLIECAIRETAEETKRDCVLLEKDPIYIEDYVTSWGEDVEMYYFIGKDVGPSDNTSEETHTTYWIPFDEVEDILSYDSLKKVWNSIKDKVKTYLK